MRTNTNIVRKKIQKHIKEYYTKKELKEQIDHMRHGSKTVYNLGIDMVQGGSFLIYYEEVKDFLNGLGINPNNKEYENEESWKLYCRLIATNITKIYNDEEVK